MVEDSAAQGESLDLDGLGKRVRQLVSADRFEHIERVKRLALDIAISNGFSAAQVSQVALAALLHDAARDLPDEELLALAPPENQVEQDHPIAVHGRAARVLAQGWGVEDAVVLGAIEGHVCGVDPSDLVGMAVYVADVSEPARGVNDDIRELALLDLGAAYRRAVATKVEYLEGEGLDVHPITRKTYEALHDAS